MTDWKQQLANDAAEAVDHELVQDIMKQFAKNISTHPEIAAKGWDAALFQYSLKQVVNCAAQVARAQALGFDPDLLRMSLEEINEATLKRDRERRRRREEGR